MSDTPRHDLDRALEVPLLDLDDHRLQPPSVTRPRGSSASRTRRGTFASIEDPTTRGRMDLTAADREFLTAGTSSRDIEQAIIDDNDRASLNSIDPPIRRSSLRHQGTVKKQRRESSRSPSPPNSISAFADYRRRERSNTANQESPEFLRTESIENPRRKLTFSEGGDAKNQDAASSTSTDTEAEQDVCYPQSEHPSEGPEIDFEELEEYVAEVEQTAPTTPAIPAQEVGDEEQPTTLPPAALSEDAFDELEKVKNAEVPYDRRASQVEVAKPLFTYFAVDNEDTIHATSLGGLLTEGETFKQLFTDSEDACWWLDVVRPTEDEVTVLCKAFSVHPLTREDITQQEAREKVEMFNHYYFVAFRSFEEDKNAEDYLEPIYFYAVVFRYGIMTFSHSSTRHSSNVLRRISRLRDYMQISPDWIVYALIDDIVDNFQPTIREVDSEVDQIEDQVFVAREEDAREILAHIGECRKKVMSLLRLLGGKGDVIKGFAKRCNPRYSVAPTSDVGMYLSDIQDHIVTMRDNLSHSEQLLSRVHTNFLAQVNLEHINSGNKTNRMLGKVTLIATILVPMNLVTGLFGMNVKVPWREVDNLGPWMGILGFIGLFSLTCVLIFRRLRLI